MGKVLSIISRPVKDFNIENRVHKAISVDKIKPAPKHGATLKEIERIKLEYPEAEKKLHEKNEPLDTRLKDVYVKSYDTDPIIYNTEGKKSKILPVDRSQVEDFEYGYKEPQIVPKGKITLRQALKFISDHAEDPKKNDINTISETYNLSVGTTENILKYFRMYQVYIPEIKKTQATFAFPKGLRKNLLGSKPIENKSESGNLN